MNRLLKAMLLLNFALILMFQSCGQPDASRLAKSPEQYWAETGLSAQELENLLSPDVCSSEERSFLACVNAIGQIAEKYNLVLSPEGELLPMRPQDIANRLSEKRDLSRWKAFFSDSRGKIHFLGLFHDLESRFMGRSEKASVIASGINAFLSVYKDPHTYILPIAMYEEVVSNSETRNNSAGFIARHHGSELIVRKVYPGSSAEKAGLRKGDRIEAMNGLTVARLLPAQISEMVKMKSVARLGLNIVRKGKKSYLEVVRSELSFPSVQSQLMGGSRPVGLITIHKFSRQTCQMARQELQILKEQNIQGLLLDLRDNPGGQVEEAACVANLFIDQGALMFETRYLDSTKPSDQYFAEEEPLYKGPLAVLINSGSASASEIVAGALRDQNRAKLVGERSFGKGTFQDGQIWGPNPKIALFQTEGLYYFPSGWTPQLVGLQPDIEVKFNQADLTREEELFFSPLVPLDSWSGPQSLSWLTERECQLQDIGVAGQGRGFENVLEDPQLQKAQAFLSCGEKNDRNGSL